MNAASRGWFAVAVALTLFGGAALRWDNTIATALFVPLWLVIIWAFTLLGWRTAANQSTQSRKRGVGLAFSVLFAVIIVTVAGLIFFAPARANPPTLGYFFHVLATIWLIAFAVGFNTNEENLRGFGARVAASRWSGALVTLVMVFMLLLLIEFGLRFFAIQSFGASSSILTANYLGVTWGQPNALGFRDNRAPTPPDDDTLAVLLVGDSVAAGFGVDDRADRLGDRLDAMLGNDAAVYLVAKPGWESQTQLREAQAYPVPPDVVIVSYYINDVNEAYAEFNEPVEPPTVDNIFINTLFIPNFLYWNVFNNRLETAGVATYDERVLTAHAEEIRAMVNWSREQGAAVVYVLWAHPVTLDAFDPLLNTVRRVLDAEAVPYVDMKALMEPYPVHERIVTVYDPHPSVAMHRLAADAVYTLLLDMGVISP